MLSNNSSFGQVSLNSTSNAMNNSATTPSSAAPSTANRSPQHNTPPLGPSAAFAFTKNKKKEHHHHNSSTTAPPPSATTSPGNNNNTKERRLLNPFLDEDHDHERETSVANPQQQMESRQGTQPPPSCEGVPTKNSINKQVKNSSMTSSSAGTSIPNNNGLHRQGSGMGLKEASQISLPDTPNAHEYQPLCQCHDCQSVFLDSTNYSWINTYANKHLPWEWGIEAQFGEGYIQQAAYHAGLEKFSIDKNSVNNNKKKEQNTDFPATFVFHLHYMKNMTKKTRDFSHNAYLRDINPKVIKARHQVFSLSEAYKKNNSNTNKRINNDKKAADDDDENDEELPSLLIPPPASQQQKGQHQQGKASFKPQRPQLPRNINSQQQQTTTLTSSSSQPALPPPPPPPPSQHQSHQPPPQHQSFHYNNYYQHQQQHQQPQGYYYNHDYYAYQQQQHYNPSVSPPGSPIFNTNGTNFQTAADAANAIAKKFLQPGQEIISGQRRSYYNHLNDDRNPHFHAYLMHQQQIMQQQQANRFANPSYAQAPPPQFNSNNHNNNNKAPSYFPGASSSNQQQKK